MIIYIGPNDYDCFDYFPVIFMLLATIGLVLAIFALIKWRNVKNNQRSTVVALAITTIVFYCGAIVMGIIGCYAAYCCYNNGSIDHYHRSACSWVCLGLGSATLLFGVISLWVQVATKNFKAVSKENKYKYACSVVDLNTSENYVESRFGAIQLFEDYFVVSVNFVPFKSARGKRADCIIYYNQLVNAMFRPAGWFRGHIWFWTKSCMRQKPDIIIPFKLWLPSSSRANSKEYEVIYNKIVAKMHSNNKEIRDKANKTVLY